MQKTSLAFAILIISLSSLNIVESESSQMISNPYVPEFVSIKYVNDSVEVEIRNQYYIPHIHSVFYSWNNITNYYIALTYNFRYKGHLGNEWKYYPISESGLSTNKYSDMSHHYADFPDFNASTSAYTNLSINLQNLFAQPPNVGEQIDFQVQAQKGYIDSLGAGVYSFTGESSDWSNTQTVTISETSDSPSLIPSPTPSITRSPFPTPISSSNNLTSSKSSSTSPHSSPTVPEFPATLATIFLAMIALAVAVVFRRRT